MRLRTKKRIDLYLGSMLVILFRPLAVFFGLFLRRAHDLKPNRRLYFLKLQGGGSLAIAYPALLGIRDRYPNIELGLVTTRALVPFGEALRIFDQIVVVDDRSAFLLVTSGLTALKQLFLVDTFVDLEVYSRLSSVFVLLSCARNRITFYLETTFWRKKLATHLVFFNRASGSFAFYDQIAYLLSATPATIGRCRERLGISTQTSGPTRRVAIGHGCSELSRERMLSVDQWVRALARKFREGDEAEISILGVASESADAEKIKVSLHAAFPNFRIENLCGQLRLNETLAHLSQVDLFMGIDSALNHFARIIGVKCVSFWGPTDPSTLLRPDAMINDEVHYQKIPCSPCVHVLDDPPCRGNNLCISALFRDEDDSSSNPVWLIET